jgi:hypothetical protein
LLKFLHARVAQRAGRRIALPAPTPKPHREERKSTCAASIDGSAPLLLLLLAPCASLGAQTIEDGILMPKKALCTGFIYTHDSWDEYWEDALKRDYGNIGTITDAERRGGWAARSTNQFGWR